jgi:subtilisin family serine protease
MIRLGPGLQQSSREGRGKGVRILVLDSGVECGHVHFQGRPPVSWVLSNALGGNWSVDPEPGLDAYGHGTAICGLLREGAPDAELHSLRILDKDLRAPAEAVLAGLEWGVRQGYDLLHCSFGTLSPRWIVGFKRIIDLAYCANVWVVAAAATAGCHATDLPAHFPSVFATTLCPPGEHAIRYLPGSLVEFQAPGDSVGVPWKGGGYRICTGSSFAAPRLTGLLARTFEGSPRPCGATGKAVIQALLEWNPSLAPTSLLVRPELTCGLTGPRPAQPELSGQTRAAEGVL